MTYDATKDPFGSISGSASSTARSAAAVTPNDDDDLSVYAKALFIGVGGDVVAIPVGNADDAPVTFKNCASGSILPVQVRRVKSTNTTATNILALRG